MCLATATAAGRDLISLQVSGTLSTGLAGARFDNQLFKANKPLLEFADQVAQNDLLPTCLLDNVKKPEWAKSRKSHGKAFGWSFTGAEAAEMAADKTEKKQQNARRAPHARRQP